MFSFLLLIKPQSQGPAGSQHDMAHLQGVGAAFDATYTPDSRTFKSYTISDLDGRPNVGAYGNGGEEVCKSVDSGFQDESETSSQTSLSLSGSPPAGFATHDTSRAHHHMRDLDRLVKDLNLVQQFSMVLYAPCAQEAYADALFARRLLELSPTAALTTRTFVCS
jgi:hypothetical protein